MQRDYTVSVSYFSPYLHYLLTELEYADDWFVTNYLLCFQDSKYWARKQGSDQRLMKKC